MKKQAMIFSLATAALLITAACSNGTKSEDSGETIPVAVGNAYPPFTYLDDSGEPSGYDIEVLKKVDEKLPEYTFTYQPYEFKTILTAIDSGQARIASHQFTINEERQKRYLFGQNAYTIAEHFIVTKADSDFNPQSLADLAGKNVYVATGTNYAFLLDEYNAENDKQINVKYGEMNMDVITQEVLSGSADATLFSEFDIANINAQSDDAFKSSSEPVISSETYFIFSQNDADLQQDVDNAVKELQDEGVLDQIKADVMQAQ